MSRFYVETIQSLNLPHSASVLVVCGGRLDQESLLECGFSNVTISNLDATRGNDFPPYGWSFQDVEALTFPDNSFDYTIVHDGLHHCASPHRGLLEMYRVARKGVLVCESRDTLLMRFAVAMKWIPPYEVRAVLLHGCETGGVRNSSTPNFVYRWTEREVKKTIASFAPEAPHNIQFFYGLRVPRQRLPFHSSKHLGWVASFSEWTLNKFVKLFKKQGNSFAFFIPKPDEKSLFPWMASRNEFNRDYVPSRAERL